MACLCAGVSYADLDHAIAADGAASVDSLGAALGCGTQCGSCIPAIKEALGEVAWFAATVSSTPMTRATDSQGLERLIFRVEISLYEAGSYPLALPGQHVVLRARTDEGLVERTYTVVAQDQAARKLTIAIRRNPNGKLTPWLLEACEGDVLRRVEVSVPGGPGLGLGSDGPQTHVFLAGGVGVTPAMAMANALDPASRMHLVYSVTHADDAAFLPELEARRKERPLLRYSVRDTSASGHISGRHIDRLLEKYPDAKFYICGPQGYIDVVHRALKKARVDADRIHVERFSLAAAPVRSARSWSYVAGALLALLPLLLLLPALQDLRPHGHPNVGHEQLKCVSCHVESSATARQTFQAKVKHAVGLRQTGAVMGMLPVTSATCIQCHANPDDTHATNRFLEPRFDQARADTGAQLCVSCHREHSGARVTVPTANYCVSCHQDMKIKNDKTSPTHELLVQQKRWNTCLQCHDYHGNHRFNAPLRLKDATTLEVLNRYLKDGPSPFGDSVVKSKPVKPS